MSATVIFDLDGTLVDTAPDLVNACNHAITGAGLAPVAEDFLRPFISFGSRRMIVEALGHHGTARPDGEIDRMWRAFLDHYEANIAVDSRPYPHVVEALDHLAEAGVRIGVCTNKLEGLSIRLLDALGLRGRFAAICGRDTFPVSKPDPSHLVGTIVAAGGDLHKTVMVGDSDTDVATARAAGVPIIGVGFGYSETPMHQLFPDALIESYAEFPRAWAGLRG